MKKVAILLALFCMLTVTASAAYIPEDVISENRDGRQLIVKTYMLPPDADPSGLVEEPFEVEGYSYHHLETVKEEQTFEDSKIQTEVVTLETDADDLAAILEQLDASMEYNKDGYSGVLTLDHTTIQTEAAGYHDLEIARMFQVKPGEIKLEMDQARSKVVPFPTETAALAA